MPRRKRETRSFVPGKPIRFSKKEMTELIKSLDPLEIRKREEKERKEEENRRKELFIADAVKAGFTHSQAEFLHVHTVGPDHEHWDGRIGG